MHGLTTHTNQVHWHNFSIKHFFVHPKKSKQLVGNIVWFLTVSTFILFNNEFLITWCLQKNKFLRNIKRRRKKITKNYNLCGDYCIKGSICALHDANVQFHKKLIKIEICRHPMNYSVNLFIINFYISLHLEHLDWLFIFE